MESQQTSRTGAHPLPVILVASVVQGWVLYALHLAIKNHHWPATNPAWLLGLYALFVFIPVTVQLIAPHVLRAGAWVIIAGLSAVYFYFGWFHGGTVLGSDMQPFWQFGTAFPLGLELLLLWLLLLPFLQSRVIAGIWVPSYEQLFSTAWRNKLTLAEAALFTGLFWLLLFLWQMLFHLLGIDFFRELFEEPIFIYPVTSLAFGVALHLIGSLERWTQTVLEQVLSVLKWLGVIASVILTLFTIALVFKLPTLVFSGQKAIGAGWLLWLVAVVVLFVNAAFRDGSSTNPYPRIVGIALRFVIPLLTIVALTAAYALIIRTQEYGLTVERIWAFVVAGCALIYATGYSAAAMKVGPWMDSIARVNLFTAFVLIVVMAAALTPLLSPYRLAADSQFKMVFRWHEGFGADNSFINSPFHYLRFDTGAYGETKLQELANGKEPTVTPMIRQLAASALAQKNEWETPVTNDAETKLSAMAVYPAGHVMSNDLRLVLKEDLHTAGMQRPAMANCTDQLSGLYADLNGDGVEEFVLLTGYRTRVYQQVSGKWRAIGDLYGGGCGGKDSDIRRHLAAGDFAVVPRTWKNLRIGDRSYRFATEPQ
ncbi:MAG: hypothetical protein ACYC9H_13700 [Sulfuricaulis sp.]